MIPILTDNFYFLRGYSSFLIFIARNFFARFIEIFPLFTWIVLIVACIDIMACMKKREKSKKKSNTKSKSKGMNSKAKRRYLLRPYRMAAIQLIG